MTSAPFRLVELLPHLPPYGGDLLHQLGLRGLHCGCGHNLREGWLNTDVVPLNDHRSVRTEDSRLARIDGRVYYLQHDAARSFPLESGCVDWVYSEHFMEHLPPDAAVAWLREVRRLLRPGGHVRLSTPDLRRYVSGYLDEQGRFFSEHRRRLMTMGMKYVPERRAWMVNQIFRHWGHQWIYDVDEIRYVAHQACFSPEAVMECEFRKGAHAQVADLDLPVRNDESLYVEIRRL